MVKEGASNRSKKLKSLRGSIAIFQLKTLLAKNPEWFINIHV